MQQFDDFEGDGLAALPSKLHAHGREHGHKKEGYQQRIGHSSW